MADVHVLHKDSAAPEAISNLPLAALRDLLYPAFWAAELEDRFSLEISKEDGCVFVQSKSEPSLKYAIAFAGDQVSLISDRLKYVKRQ